jgi:lipopolysaccharide export system protein LptA
VNAKQPSVAAPAPVTHILSASARFFHATKLAEFHGTDAAPAKMWQDASQVQAATLLFDGLKRTLSARPVAVDGKVHAVFAGTPAKPNGATNIVRVASPKMDYNDLLREATFSSGVTIDGTMGEVKSQRAVVFLAPAKAATEKPVNTDTQPNPFRGSVDRVVLSGDVNLEQPGRSGTGEQMLYTAGSNTYVLTGTADHPPHIVDAKQGNVTGTTLLFGDAGSTIVVAGEPASKKRVRTETEVRP